MEQNIAADLQRAMSLHQAGRLDEAEAIYRGIMRVQRHHPDATHLLAMLTHQRGDTQAALLGLDRLLRTHPTFAAAENSRGLMLIALGRHREAIAAFDRAIATNPTYTLPWINRARALAELRQYADALACYDRAIAAEPRNAEAHYAKGVLLQGTGQAADARACYDRALAIRPDFPEALNNRAATLERLGLFDEALADYARAIELRPGLAEAWNNQGVALDRVGRHDEAIGSFRRAIAVRPDFKGALANLADSLYVVGRRTEALATVARCLCLDPADMKARILRTIYQLPILYDRESEITERRDAYEAELRALCAVVDADPQPGRFANAVGTSQPFFLAYQGRCDLELQRLYGGMMNRILADRQPTLRAPPEVLRKERIRVGFVCGFFRQHPVWRVGLHGWVSQLDRTRFEIFGYHTSGVRDTETETAAAACDQFVQGPRDVSAWRERILADALDVLIYPEIGMDGMAALLAPQRLAAIQCCGWGHPDTSGLPTIDYFLSSAEMEPEDGDAHYTEHLVRLPGLGIYYEPRAIKEVPFSRADMGVRPGIPVFWCGQSLYKYLPQHDEIYPRIARAVGDCQFAFIAYPRGTEVTEQFRRRLARAFAAFGLDSSAYCVILPRLDGNQYAAAIGQCDVMLDSIGWSGFNTNVEGFVHNKPIVTLAGPLMRGRHSTAVLRIMGLRDAIASTVDEYVTIASALGRDADARAAMAHRVAEAKHRVYRDREPIVALENFLERALRRSAVDR